ncbi:hypothetical protein NPIL_73841 [Nephila pilipes]|uniref:Uncharacterized protein n=1 Tax=Nephila pilipes TaxID=299642 RepID=A0A8X6TG34_NEPPI|nr:hypothetical protein NPIL_73841 [Nephila pilipes]
MPVASLPSSEATVPVPKQLKAKRVRFDLPEPCPGPSLQSKGLSSSPSGGHLTDPAGSIPQSLFAPGAAGPVPTFLTKFQRDWSDRVKCVGSAEELDEAYSQFIHALGGRPSRRLSGPRNSTPRNNNSRLHQPPARPAESTSSTAGPSSSALSAGEPLTKGYDPAEASKLQKLFRANQKKALQSILSGPPKYCEIPPNAVEDHFRQVFSENPHE